MLVHTIFSKNIGLYDLWEIHEKTLRLWNTGLVSSRASFTSWGEGASLALVGDLFSDGVTMKMSYGVDVLHRPS